MKGKLIISQSKILVDDGSEYIALEYIEEKLWGKPSIRRLNE